MTYGKVTLFEMVSCLIFCLVQLGQLDKEFLKKKLLSIFETGLPGHPSRESGSCDIYVLLDMLTILPGSLARTTHINSQRPKPHKDSRQLINPVRSRNIPTRVSQKPTHVGEASCKALQKDIGCETSHSSLACFIRHAKCLS